MVRAFIFSLYSSGDVFPNFPFPLDPQPCIAANFLAIVEYFEPPPYHFLTASLH